MTFRPTTGRRKVWVALLVFVLITSLTDAGSPAEIAGYIVGLLIIYLLPIAAWKQVQKARG